MIYKPIRLYHSKCNFSRHIVLYGCSGYCESNSNLMYRNPWQVYQLDRKCFTCDANPNKIRKFHIGLCSGVTIEIPVPSSCNCRRCSTDLLRWRAKELCLFWLWVDHLMIFWINVSVVDLTQLYQKILIYYPKIIQFSCLINKYITRPKKKSVLLFLNTVWFFFCIFEAVIEPRNDTIINKNIHIIML